MSAIRIRKTVESETLHLPELKPLVGRTVDITISAGPDPLARGAFDELVGKVPESEAGWAERQATLRGWQTDVRFESYRAVIEQMLEVDFVSFQRLAAVRQRMGGIEGYDAAAWREQRDYDLKHTHDHLS